MKRKTLLKKISALLLCACLILGLFPLATFATEETIRISDIDDWNDFAKKCTLDSWSQGKTVILESDLHLKKAGIVPTFGGTFDGNGHTISGLNIEKEGSNMGLFRYLQAGGVIQNLKVTGTVDPSGTTTGVGGIVGSNSGKILQCSFRGNVTATTGVGGIAGINESTGEITNCAVNGNVSGEHYTGGIAGENYGSIVLCKNRAQVNTHETNVSPNLDTVDWNKLNSTENVPACTDSGGITGFSKGILQNCTNYGTVGYAHTGYNVGGVVGRQAGYMDGCINNGKVLGRKDVGGVVGQMEPYTLLQFQADTMNQLYDALDQMSNLLDTTLTHAQSNGQDISGEMTGINTMTDDIRSDLDGILDDLDAWSNGTIDTVNDLSARISRVLNQMSPVITDLETSTREISNACTELRNGIDKLDEVNDPNAQVYKDIHATLDSLKIASDNMQAAMESISDAIEEIQKVLGDDTATAAELSKLSAGFQQLSDSSAEAAVAAGDLSHELSQLQVNDEEQAALRTAAQSAEDAQSALNRMSKAAGSFDWNDLKKVDWDKVMKDLAKATTALNEAASALSDAAETGKKALEEIQSILKAAAPDFKDALTDLADGTSALSNAFNKLNKIVKEQADQKTLQLPKLDSGYHEKQDHLNTTLGNLSDQLENLNQTANQTGTQLTNDLKKVNQQFTVITQIMRNASNDGTTTVDNMIVDVSDEATSDDSTVGKVTRCINKGIVEGDLDVGGVAGSMAVEFDFDPEDDVTKNGSDSLKFQYLTRAVLRDSKNYGSITARKNDLGGIVGRMDLGLVANCESYGDLESTSGDYVGGIAGLSSASIQSSWVKCHIKGERYLGGVVGEGTNISDCRVFVSIDETLPYTGSIAGTADGQIARNYFVGDDTLGGIDGISYEGRAQSISYADLMEEDAVPEELKAFKLTFAADDKIVTSRVFRYGDALSEDRMPAVPEKDGFYGAWEEFDPNHLTFDMTIHAKYTPWETTLVNDSGSILVEGEFKTGTELETAIGTESPAELTDPAAQWNIRLNDSKQNFTAIRVKQPSNVKHPVVWVKANENDWEKLSFTTEGSYLKIPLIANQAEVCIGELTTYWIVRGAIIAAVILLFIVIMLVLWKKGKLKRPEKKEHKPHKRNRRSKKK